MIDFELIAAQTDPKLLAIYDRMVRFLETKSETLEEGLGFAVDNVLGAVGHEQERIDYQDSLHDLRHALVELRLTRQLLAIKERVAAA